MPPRKPDPKHETRELPAPGKEANSPCYFSELKVTNVHCFRNQQILNLRGENGEFAQWTILLGDNGMGKTTLLQCLAAMLPEDTATEFAGKKYWNPRIREYGEWYAGLGHTSSSQWEVEVTVSFKLDANWEKETVSYAAYRKPSEQSQKTYPSAVFGSYAEPPGHFVAYGYGAMRRLHRTESSEPRQSDRCATLFDDNKPLLNAEQWLRNADYAATKAKTDDAEDRLEKVRRLLVDLLPDVSGIRIPARGHNLPIPEARTPFGWVPVNSLSTGYRSVLAWVVDFASRMMDRYPKAKNPFAMPAVVLVDQIDLYLHPKWQRQMMERLTCIFKKTQFIVTAHSPLIIQAVPGANLALLKRQDNEVKIVNQLGEIRGWRTDQLLASDLFEALPTRDDETERLMNERYSILGKSTLTPLERNQLERLNAKLANIPYGESPEQAEMLALLKKAARDNKKAAPEK